MADDEHVLEINFRLDSNGRTLLENGESNVTLDYNSRVIQTQLKVPKEDATYSSLHRELLLDCEISDSGLMPRTFWIGANAQPRCHLEQLAKDVFDFHVPSTLRFDHQSSGAEWWVQLRPSPEAGRYSMHAKDQSDNGICFHWDKDEDLRIVCGGQTYVHPHLSTVTYLTNLGAPTIVVNGARVNNLTGEWMEHDQKHLDATICWPSQFKHLSFDGRYLHAAPSDLQEPGAFEEQCRVPDGKDKRLYRRCTFLVNIWLNHQPFNVHPFPETMIDKLSGCQPTDISGERELARLLFLEKDKESDSSQIETVAVESETETSTFSWPMGGDDSGETIRAALPLQLIRAKAATGGNVRVSWPSMSNASGSPTVSGITLHKAAPTEAPPAKRPKQNAVSTRSVSS